MAKVTEAMTAPLPDTGARQFAAAARMGSSRSPQRRDAVGLGPGIGARARQRPRARAREAARSAARDRRGRRDRVRGRARAAAHPQRADVLTPHPARRPPVLGVRPAQINADRAGAARELAAKSGAVVVLKGAGTAIAAPTRALREPDRRAALASGGNRRRAARRRHRPARAGVPALHAARSARSCTAPRAIGSPRAAATRGCSRTSCCSRCPR